jgi:hypothetical protein
VTEIKTKIAGFGAQIDHCFDEDVATALLTYPEIESGMIGIQQVVAPVEDGHIRLTHPGIISETVVTVQIDEGDA